jgi:uncharacterized protein GlcG (DUF336 family)
MLKPSIGVLFISLFTLGPVNADNKAFVTTRTLAFETANQLAIESARACRKQGYQVAVSVVDRNGNILAMLRDPLAGTHTLEVSRQKAYTAATFQTATTEMKNFDALRFAPEVLLVGGGVPIKVGGHFYGAVGVSGAPAKKFTGDVDEECALAGIESISEALEFAE